MKRAVIDSFEAPIEISQHGHKFAIRPSTSDYFTIRELFENKEYSRYLDLKSDDIWLDVGAHIGVFAIQIYKYTKIIHSMEAEQGNYDLLRYNVKLNNVQNVICYHGAITHLRDLTIPLYVNRYMSKGMHSTIPIKGRKIVSVPAYNINEFICRHGITKVKMDIEGSETAVIENMDDIVLGSLDEIVVEYHPSKRTNSEKNYKAIVCRLSKFFGRRKGRRSTNAPTWPCVLWFGR